jgi:glycosyltransferase involved in cell wall biosynthesis
VSDDGSSDNTLDILQSHQRQWGKGKLSIQGGPRQGFAANFLNLTCQAEIKADFYAYADQDDIWEADKLERAVNWLKTIPADVPALYCSRTRLVDEENKTLGFSPLFKRPPSFANALMQNIGGGNTMVFNHATRKLLCQAGKDIEAVSHDWWAYILVTGCGGKVLYDEYPSVRYRQHNANIIGSNKSLYAIFITINKLILGEYKEWYQKNINALKKIEFLINEEDLHVLNQYKEYRNGGLRKRICLIWKKKIHRQTVIGDLAISVAIFFKKI